MCFECVTRFQLKKYNFFFIYTKKMYIFFDKEKNPLLRGGFIVFVEYSGLIDGSLTPNVIRNNGRCGKLSRRLLRMSFGTMDDTANLFCHLIHGDTLCAGDLFLLRVKRPRG